MGRAVLLLALVLGISCTAIGQAEKPIPNYEAIIDSMKTMEGALEKSLNARISSGYVPGFGSVFVCKLYSKEDLNKLSKKTIQLIKALGPLIEIGDDENVCVIIKYGEESKEEQEYIIIAPKIGVNSPEKWKFFNSEAKISIKLKEKLLGEKVEKTTVTKKKLTPAATKFEVYPLCKKPARETGSWKLTYEVKITKESNKAEVIICLEDPNDNVREIALRRRPYGPYHVPKDYITNLHSKGGKVSSNAWEVKGITKAKLFYTVDLNLKYREGGYSGFACSNWIVTAGDFLFIINGWSGTSKYPHVNVKLDAPSGWEVYTPYPEIKPGLYDATDIIGHITPRDFIVAGDPKILEVAIQEKAGTKYTVVIVDSSAVSAQEIVEFIAKVGTEFSNVAACRPSYILSVIVPEPMRRHGGEGKDISIQVSDDNPFPFDLSWGSSTFAHELFHLYQRYYSATDESWIKEGVATYYQFYGPLKAGYMTAEEFWNVMVKVEGARARKGAVLSKGEDSYFKGSLSTLALDVKIRQDTEGKSSFDNVFRILNRDFAQKYVSSSVLKLVISSLTICNYNDFFEKYIQGSDYPDKILASGHKDYITFLNMQH